MPISVLLTSFTTWKSEQPSNASDDLLEELLQRHWLQQSFHLMRQVPVHFRLAPNQVIATLEALQPEIIICCGMAEKRTLLTVETNGSFQGETLHTRVNVEALVSPLAHTAVSHDAGTFVCNYLYYRLLKHLRSHPHPPLCLFVHVPVLTAQNRDRIVKDFRQILNQVNNFR